MESKKSVRLLVIHDTEHLYEALQDVAEMNSHVYDVECMHRSSGREAKELISDWRPTIVLLDAHIHDVNSIEFLRDCRSSGIPVILTSHHNSVEIEKSAMNNGAIGYCPLVGDPETVEQVLSEIVMYSEEVCAVH